MAKQSLTVVEQDVDSPVALSEAQQALVETLVEGINRVHRTGALQTAFSVGKLIVDIMYGGDIGQFRVRGKGDPTWRALATHPDLEFKHSALWYAVALHENYAILGDELATSLTLGHHRLLAHVIETERRREHAERAVSERLSVRALEDQIKAKRAKPGQQKRGRKAIPEPLKHIGRAWKEIQDLDISSELDSETRRKALIQTQQLLAKLAELAARLGDAGGEVPESQVS